MTDTILFDLDGTLLDTLDDLWASVNYSLAHNNMPLRSKEEVRRFLGNGAKRLIYQSLPKDKTSTHFDSTYNCFKQYYAQHSTDMTHPYPGVLDMLSELKSRGFHTAIVSNKPDFAVQKLYKLFFQQYIDVAIGQREGLNRKPSADMVNRALLYLGSSLSSSVYVGDSEVDIQTAHNSRLPCIIVSWRFRDRSFLLKQGAKTIIDVPSELSILLK